MARSLCTILACCRSLRCGADGTGRQSVSEIRSDVHMLHARQDQRGHQEGFQLILDWLTPLDYAIQQSDMIKRRQEGTGQWLINSGQFQNWVDRDNQTLFCPGIPGAGKTVSTAIVIDYLYTRFQHDASFGIAYVYCDFRRQKEQEPVDLLAGLLRQLLQNLDRIPQDVQELYNRHRDKRTRPTLEEVSPILTSIVTGFSKTFIIVDALDECELSGQKPLLTKLFNIQLETTANLFATSRPIPNIEKHFEGRSTQIEVRASEKDLERYVDKNIEKLPQFVLRRTDLRDEVKSTIIKVVDGM